MKQIAVFAFLVSLATSNSSAAETQCSPAEFAAKDPQWITVSDFTRIAFIRTATKEQYEEAKAILAEKLNVGMLNGPFDYVEAQEVAKSEAQALKFDLDRQNYSAYLSQKIGDSAKAMYIACLRGQKTGEGLRLWLDRREGDYYFINGFWIGADPKAKGLLNKNETMEDGVGIIKIPDEWPPKAERSIVLKAGKTSGGMINIAVGAQSKSLVFYADPPHVNMINVEYRGPEMVARSGGATSCERQTEERCLTPKNPGGYFVPKTVRFEGSRASDTGFEITRDTTSQVCVRVWALSPVCQTEVRVDGRPVVVERYPVP
jgi:hypothetical protein